MNAHTETAVLVPVEILQELRACIIGFEADKRCDLTPTDESLNTARELIRSALDAPRSFHSIAAAKEITR